MDPCHAPERMTSMYRLVQAFKVSITNMSNWVGVYFALATVTVTLGPVSFVGVVGCWLGFFSTSALFLYLDKRRPL